MKWNGDIYAGQWKDDKRNGQAFYKQHKGYIFLTNWKDDEIVTPIVDPQPGVDPPMPH